MKNKDRPAPDFLSLDGLVSSISEIPGDWHGAGTVVQEVLEAILSHSRSLGKIHRTVETGSGRTTLLFSHLSASHTVFALDMDNSVTRVKECPLLNASSTTFIEAPTQRSLPAHQFDGPIQIAMIDGPHGYPFPDLEFYYLYPQISVGGLLIIDDIKIPSVGRMNEIISNGPMFEPIEIVAENTAFLRRTDAPLLDPEGDDWWLWNINQPYYERLMRPARPTFVSPLIHWAARSTPTTWQRFLPRRIKKALIKLT